MEYRAEGEEQSAGVRDWDPDEIVKHAAAVSTMKENYMRRQAGIL